MRLEIVLMLAEIVWITEEMILMLTDSYSSANLKKKSPLVMVIGVTAALFKN